MTTYVGTDINPYKLKAPWHAFEFAFHILEVRANLAIVTMAWLTGEDCEHFTQFPNEPDMEALTYWAQRLEPVIRDESRDEVIIVFCNRSGIEGDAVYAGTSAVIGIHQGEVKVYGLLGRGVKELLVVDTDDAPLGNLILREKKVYLSPTQYELRASEQGTDANSLELRPSPASSLERTPTKYLPDQEIQRLPSRFSKNDESSPSSSATRNTPVVENLKTPTPATPSPVSSSSRLQPPASSCRSSQGQIACLDAKAASTLSRGRITEGIVKASTDEDQSQAAKGLPDHVPSDPSILPGLLHDRAPLKAQQSLGSPNKQCLKFSVEGARESKSHRQRDRSPKPGESLHGCAPSVTAEQNSRSRKLSEAPVFDHFLPTRPSTATGTVPPRPSSPKSRTASRTRCHRRNRSEVEHSDAVPILEHLESVQDRSRSMTAQHQDHGGPFTWERNRSPRSRSAVRPGPQARRYLNLDQGLVERALEFYLRSIPIDSRDSVLAANSYRARSDNVAREHNSSQYITIGSSSEVYHYTSSASGRTSSCTRASTTPAAAAKPQLQSNQSRTAVWMEISKLVGDHLRRPQSEESTRGRRRSRSGSSTEARRGSTGTSPATRLTDSHTEQSGISMRSCSVDSTRAQLGSRDASIATSTALSRTRQRIGGAIRSVRDPSLGPPSDPEDEIIAEITFRSPCCPTCGSIPSSEGSTTGTPKKALGRRVPGKDTRQEQGSGPGPDRLKRHPPSDDDNERTPTNIKRLEALQDSGPLSLQTAAEQLDKSRAPSLSRASIRTLSSYEPSPITPPPQSLMPELPNLSCSVYPG